MLYLLDTCVISDFIKGEPGTQTWLKQTPPAKIAVSVITGMELAYGLELNPQRAQKIEPIIDDFLSSVAILPFNTPEAEKAAEIRAILKTQGQPIGASIYWSPLLPYNISSPWSQPISENSIECLIYKPNVGDRRRKIE